VLAGAIENILLEVYPDQNGDFNMANISQTGGVDDVVPAHTRVRMRVKSREMHEAGSMYELAPRLFHFTNVHPDHATITVVESTVAVEGGPRTLVPVGTVEHAPARTAVAEPGVIFAEIERLLSR
jgi:hypothetical protein